MVVVVEVEDGFLVGFGALGEEIVVVIVGGEKVGT